MTIEQGDSQFEHWNDRGFNLRSINQYSWKY